VLLFVIFYFIDLFILSIYIYRKADLKLTAEPTLAPQEIFMDEATRARLNQEQMAAINAPLPCDEDDDF
jgi:hypothetical protein